MFEPVVTDDLVRKSSLIEFMPSLFDDVPWYRGTLFKVEIDLKAGATTAGANFVVERVQTGVRMEKRLLKVLKAFAEFHDMTLGDLLEGIVLHAFDGKCPFQANSLRRIKELKQFYGLRLDSRASHRMREQDRDLEAAQKKPRSAKKTLAMAHRRPKAGR
jgi:hypothetical protein